MKSDRAATAPAEGGKEGALRNHSQLQHRRARQCDSLVEKERKKKKKTYEIFTLKKEDLGATRLLITNGR